MPHWSKEVKTNTWAGFGLVYVLNSENRKTSWYNLTDADQPWMHLYHKNLHEQPDPHSEGFSNELSEVETWLEFSPGQPIGQLDGTVDFSDLEAGAVPVVDNRQDPALGIRASNDRIEPYQHITGKGRSSNVYVRIVMGEGRPGSRVAVGLMA